MRKPRVQALKLEFAQTHDRGATRGELRRIKRAWTRPLPAFVAPRERAPKPRRSAQP